MFQPGDLIIYGRTGVCRVERIEVQDDRQYYCLQALYQTCMIHAPVNGKVLMRPVLSREGIFKRKRAMAYMFRIL